MCCATVFLSVVAPVFGQDPSQQGRTTPVAGVKVSPDDQANFDLASSYDEAGATQQAIAAYRQFMKAAPASPLASKAQYRIAELYEAADDYSKAFDAYQTLISRYPDTPEFEKAVTRQVLIAN
ncbi:MAG: tetratricopeptide repeat protein, partial [Terrimicrobiaceae bacterium]|nr:tetratricopeptide repeat protein [Terrimicrobiaceae bacterium]